MRIPLLLLLPVCLLAGVEARAQQPSQAQAEAIRQSCRVDYQSYCASVPTGGQAALACLQQHRSSLSAACRKAVAAASPSGAPATAGSAAPSTAPAQHTAVSPRQELALVRSECSADYRRYCPGVRPGGGRALACLSDHQESVSQGCRQSLMSLRGGQ
jgi:hypothetical protein